VKESFFVLNLMQFKAPNHSLLNDEEFFTSITFLNNEFFLLQLDCLKSVNKLKFLEFVKGVEKLDVI